jgi:hypothetical protein
MERANSEVMVRSKKVENSLKVVKRKAAEQVKQRYILYLLVCQNLLVLMQPSLTCSAWLRAHAVGQMKDKCEQQTRTAVGLATISMARDLKNSERLGAMLQSKLSKSEVTIPFPLFYLTLCTNISLPLSC